MSSFIEKIVLASLDKVLIPTIEKTLDASDMIVKIAESVKKLAEDVEKLATNVTTLSTTVYLHQQAITDLYTAQRQVVSVIKGSKSSSLSTDLPDIKKPEEKKPN